MLDAEQERFADRMAARLRAEQQAGRTSPNLDPLTAARVMITGGERVITTHITTTADDQEQDLKVARELAASHWYGVYRRPAEPDEWR